LEFEINKALNLFFGLYLFILVWSLSSLNSFHALMQACTHIRTGHEIAEKSTSLAKWCYSARG